MADQRVKVVLKMLRVLTQSEVARHYKVSRQAIYKVVRRARERGHPLLPEKYRDETWRYVSAVNVDLEALAKLTKVKPMRKAVKK